MNNEIVNLKECGITKNDIVGFLNNRLYSDVESYVVTATDKPNVFKAAALEREFKPEFDGLCCKNNSEQSEAPLKITGEWEEIEFRRGKYGKWVVDSIGVFGEEVANKLELKEGTTLLKLGEDKYTIAFLTKSGKLKKKWVTFGVMSKECRCFHDYNF